MALGSFRISVATQKVSWLITSSNCFRFLLPTDDSSLNKSSTYLGAATKKDRFISVTALGRSNILRILNQNAKRPHTRWTRCSWRAQNLSWRAGQRPPWCWAAAEWSDSPWGGPGRPRPNTASPSPCCSSGSTCRAEGRGQSREKLHQLLQFLYSLNNRDHKEISRM